MLTDVAGFPRFANLDCILLRDASQGPKGATTKKASLRSILSIALGVSVLAGLGINGVALAQGYPARPVKLIVPYPPGGGTDIAARWIADKLSARLNERVFVDNRAGANGNLGTDFIAKALPDGYVIGMATPGPVTVGRSLYADLPYDPIKDLAPVILATRARSSWS